MPDNHIHMVYKLGGDVKEIDVFKLAPTLLALGELIQESNQQINPQGREIGVNVRPFREGSFIIDLTIFPHTQLQQMLDLLNSSALEETKKILEWIGLIAGTNLGAVQVIKFLKGKPKSVEEISPGEFRFTAGDDKSITVKTPVYQLLSNSRITNNIFKVYVSPLDEQPYVSDVRTYIEDDEKSEVKIERQDASIFREFVNPSPIPTSPEETIKEVLHPGVYLNPKRGAFDGDAKDWSFRQGDQIIVATIRDKDFLNRCLSGEYRLNYSDLLTVELLERQRVLGTLVMKPTYEIVKVTNYVRGARQTRLDT